MSKKETNRKLHDTSIENQELEEITLFQKSKLIARSPSRSEKKNDKKEMDQILKAIQNIRSEIVERFEKSNEQTENQT